MTDIGPSGTVDFAPTFDYAKRFHSVPCNVRQTNVLTSNGHAWWELLLAARSLEIRRLYYAAAEQVATALVSEYNEQLKRVGSSADVLPYLRRILQLHDDGEEHALASDVGKEGVLNGARCALNTSFSEVQLPMPHSVPDALLRDVLRSHPGQLMPLDVVACIGEQWQRVIRSNRGGFLIDIVSVGRIDEGGIYAPLICVPSYADSEDEKPRSLKTSELGKIAFEELIVNVGKQLWSAHQSRGLRFRPEESDPQRAERPIFWVAKSQETFD